MRDDRSPTPTERVADPGATARAKRRRRRRRVGIALLALVTLVAVGFAILTRPTVLRRLLEPALTAALGGPVTLEDVHLGGLSRLHVKRLALSAPRWEGEAADLLVAEDVTLQFDPASLLVGAFTPRSLQLGIVRARLAEREDAPGSFNFLSLKPAGSDEPGSMRAVRVDLGRLELETGTVARDGTWTKIGSRTLSGYLAPDPVRRDGSLFAFRLSDVGPGGSAINGTWDERTLAFAASLDAIDLDRRVLELLPMSMRRSAEALDLAGQVRGAQFRWSPTEPLFAEFAVAQMRITLPDLDLDDRWSRFRSGKREQREGLPTMHVREGAVRLEGTHVVFKRLVGEIASNTDDPGLVPVPVELSLDIALDALFGEDGQRVDWRNAEARDAWLSETLDTAPFSLAVAIRGFDSAKAAPGYDPVLEVPTPIAAALETFGVTSWRLDVEAEFTRGPATRAADGTLTPARILSKGQCFLSNAQGSYDAFPYPMTDVKAHVSFDQDESGDDRLNVDYLAGTTQTGSTISISGTVVRPGPEAEIDLSVSAPTFTLDEQLVRCFERGGDKTLFYLFHDPSFQALDRAKLLPKDDLPALEERRKALIASAATIADPAELERLATERLRVERMIAVRPFALGGTGAIKASVRRERGPDRPIDVNGLVTIKHAGVLIDEFPYPLVVTSGTLTITETEVGFGEEGLRATTLEGGLVRIGGRMVIEKRAGGGTRVRPEITITGVRDEITPLLLAAIPASKSSPVQGWPGEALVPTARLLEAAGLRGTVDLHGTILEKPEQPGRVETTLRIEISNGSIDTVEAPDVPLALPAGLSLRELSASLLVTDDRVEFRSLTASDASGAGTVTASGSYSTTNSTESVDIRFDGMPVAPWIIAALPDAARTTGLAWWERWKPRGTFDAHLTVSSDERGSAMTTIEARPRTLTVAPYGRDVSIRGLDGSLLLVADAAGMRGDVTSLRLADGLEEDAGEVVLDGSLEAGATSLRSIDLLASADGLRFEAPLVDLLIRESGATELADGIAAMRPTGRFDGELTLRTLAGSAKDWSLVVRPITLGLDLGPAESRTRTEATFEPTSVIRATAAGVRLEKVAAAVDRGRVAVDGSIDLTRVPHVATGTYSLEAAAWSAGIASLLPPPLDLARERIAFSAEEFSLPAAQLSLHWDPARGVSDPVHYGLDGRLSMRGGTLTAGVPFTELDGEIDLGFRYESQAKDAEPVISLRAAIAAPSLRIHDRLLTQSSATITLTDDHATLQVRDIAGEIADGRLDGTADVRLLEGRYSMSVRVTGASLAPLIAPRDPESASGGQVDARLSLEGPTEGGAQNATATPDLSLTAMGRTGRGRIAIRDAAMAKSPFTLRLLQISQLMLPLSSALKTADIQFMVNGSTATFEKFELTTLGLTLDGTGTMNIDDFTVDLTLRSRGRLGIFSDIVGAVSDQLYEIEVKGPLDDPTAGLRALPGLRSRTPPADAAPPQR